MARVSFVAADGTERDVQLDATRTLSIGRDPGNDLVLRDPRVSRRHAEIVFDKGFFILRDLGSANGSYVNGKKIAVAPLIDRAQLKLGNSKGTFLREPELPDSPSSTIAVDLFKATESEAQQASDPDPFPDASVQSTYSPVVTSLDLAAEIPVDFSRVPEVRREPPEGVSDARFQLSRYVLDVSVPYGERSTVRDESGNPLFHYKRPVNLAGFITGLFATLVTLAGAGVAIFLAASGNWSQAFFAFLLTIGFILVILLMIPRRRHIYLYDDPDLTSVNLMLWQESRFSFPVLRFTVRTADGRMIASFSKTLFSAFGRHRWTIGDAFGSTRLGCAIEDALGMAILRKFLGSFFGIFKTNFNIFIGTEQVGTIDRRTSGLDRYFLDLTADASYGFDRRTALALAILIDGLERK